MSDRGKGIFTLVATGDEAILSRIVSRPDGRATAEPLARFPGNPAAPATYAGLGDALAGRRGTLAVSLPLNLFETVTLNLPLSNEEAIGRVLPFHLGKTLDRPLNNFVYDWQVVKRQKDSVRIAVFLLPAVIERGIAQALAGARLKISHLEPEIFSAFAFLAKKARLNPARTSLLVMIHRNFISQGVYESGMLRLVRVVKLATPDTPFEEISAPEGASAKAGGGADDILSSFSLSAGPETETMRMELESSAPGINPWNNYLEQLNLEIVRGRDYYSSIMKGAPITGLFIGADGEFIAPLSESITRQNDLECETMLAASGEKDALANALALGAAARDLASLERINLVPAEPLAVRFKRLPALVIGILATLLITWFAADYLNLQHRETLAKKQLATFKAKEKQVMMISAGRSTLASEIRALEDKKRDLDEKIAPLTGPVVKKNHYAAILTVISQLTPQKARCERIEFDGAGVELHGRAVDHSTIEQFADRLRGMPNIADLSINEITRGGKDQAPLTFRMGFRISQAKGQEAGKR